MTLTPPSNNELEPKDQIQPNDETNALSTKSDSHEVCNDEIQLKPASVFRQENPIARVQLQIVSPHHQLKRLQRFLPDGLDVSRVINAQTLNYKTLKPERKGLFCERTFGPVQDFVCACGKRQKTKSLIYCPDCQVEYTSSRARRYRLGYIRLGLPMTHIWYLKGRPSYLSLLLDLKKKHAESIAYGTTCVYNNFSPDFEQRILGLRSEFNQRFNKLRVRANQRPGMFFLYSKVLEGKVREDWWKTISFVDTKPDDFWVDPRNDSIPCPHFNHIKWTWDSKWRKYNFLRKKPFFQVPFMRDRFNFDYRMRPENLDGLEEYLFDDEYRTSDSTIPIPKYQKAIPNSMICYKSAREREVLLTGATAFIHLFSKIDCYRFQKSLFKYMLRARWTVLFYNGVKRRRKLSKEEKKEYKHYRCQLIRNARRIKAFRTFWRTGTRPEWMFISILPILPPDLRPIIKMSSDQLAVSDLNRLYQAVMHRNRNLKISLRAMHKRIGSPFGDAKQIEKYMDENDYFPVSGTGVVGQITAYHALRYSTSLIGFKTKLLQEAIDALLENGKGGAEPVCGTNNRPLKSLSDILKGKKGRFRQNLLGKRADYSGRSVIVVGPKLKLYQCGIPKEIALELFQALLIRKMMLLKIAKSIVSAKYLIRREHPIIWSILKDIMADSPVFLNRAPTLHRLGVQAFIPKLVRGKAILLHPLVCTAFNADFDGDQMGVHLPLSIEAKSEAWSLMLSTQNILSPATGEPILTPTQDMVLGCYYLTTLNAKRKQKMNRYFSHLNDVYKAYLNKHLHVHDFIWLRWSHEFYSNQPGKKLIEIRLKKSTTTMRSLQGAVHTECAMVETMFITSNTHKTHFVQDFPTMLLMAKGDLKDQFLRTTVGRVILNQEFQSQVNTSTIQYENTKT